MTASRRAVVSQLLTLAAALLAVRLWLLVYRAFDIDEFEHAHATWSLARGLLPYRDFFEHHTPGLYFLFRPLFARLPLDAGAAAAIDLLVACRAAMWVATAGAVALVYRIGALWGGPIVGAIAAALVAASAQFMNATLEFRPDVPAVVCVLAALLCALQIGRDPNRRVLWSVASGLAFGGSLIFTPKAVFAAPGLVAAVLLERKAWPVVAFFAASAAPGIAVFSWFAANESAAAFLEAILLANVALTADRVSPMPRLLSSVLWNPPLYLLGVGGAVAAARRGLRTPGTIVVATLVGLGGGLLVMGRTYDQYYALILPLLALCAADLIVTSTAGLARVTTRMTALACGCAALLFLGTIAATYQSNAAQRDDMAFVMGRTRPTDTILSGVPGAATFRPHAWYYFFLSGPFAGAGDYAQLRVLLESGRIRPAVVVFDAQVLAMPAPIVAYLRAHYRRARGDIFERVE